MTRRQLGMEKNWKEELEKLEKRQCIVDHGPLKKISSSVFYVLIHEIKAFIV